MKQKKHYVAPEIKSEKIQIGVFGSYGKFKLPKPRKRK